MYALYEYWRHHPPAHEVAYIGFGVTPKEGNSSKQESAEGKVDDVASANANVIDFIAMTGVSSSWKGPPPMRPQDVIRMAEEAKRKAG